jgi:hypothetical protein
VHPDYLLEYLTSEQLSEWEAVDMIDPIGTWREDLRTAKLESLITNIVNQLYCKQGHQPTLTSPLDFLIDWSGDKQGEVKKQSAQEILSFMTGFAQAQNKTRGSRKTPPKKKGDKT